jgi:hypothetical protein
MTAPIWYGQPRGTSIAPDALDFSQDDEDLPQPGFFDLLRKHLFGWPTDTVAGVLGWFAIFAWCPIAAVIAWTLDPWLALTPLLLGLAWTAVCANAALLARSDPAPGWATGLVDYLVGTGRAIVLMIQMASIIGIPLILLIAIGAARGSRYS